MDAAPGWAVHADAILRHAADDCLVTQPELQGESPTGGAAAPDPELGDDLSSTAHESAASGAPSVPLLAARGTDHTDASRLEYR
jgi:hypothetical protein